MKRAGNAVFGEITLLWRAMRSLVLAAVLVLVAVPIASSATDDAPMCPNIGPPDPAYTYLAAKNGKSSVQAAYGTYCLPLKGQPTKATGGGADAKYPLPGLKVLQVKRGSTIRLILHAPAGWITYRLARVSGGKERSLVTGEATLANRNKRAYTIKLSKTLSKRATILGLNVTYLNAYNTYEVGIKVR